jgi:hypothetical protein
MPPHWQLIGISKSGMVTCTLPWPLRMSACMAKEWPRMTVSRNSLALQKFPPQSVLSLAMDSPKYHDSPPAPHTASQSSMAPRFIPTICPCRLLPWMLPSFALSLVRALHCPIIVSYIWQPNYGLFSFCLSSCFEIIGKAGPPWDRYFLLFQECYKIWIDTSRWFHGAMAAWSPLWPLVLDTVVTNQQTAYLTPVLWNAALPFNGSFPSPLGRFHYRWFISWARWTSNV